MKTLSGVSILTHDVASLSAFYRDLLQMDPLEDGPQYSAFTANDGTVLSMFAFEAMRQLAPETPFGELGRFTLEFQVDDPDAEYARLLERGVQIVHPPETYPWGNRAIWFNDPDGNRISFFRVLHPLEQPDLKTRLRIYFQRLLNEKDLSVCEEMLAEGYVDHDAPPGMQRAETVLYVANLLADYPDMHVDIQRVVEEGNQAAAHITWHAQHAQTGATYHREGMVFLRFDEQGRIAERWSVYHQP